MPSETIVPNITHSNTWTVTGAGTAHAALDEGVDNADSADKISCSAAGKIITLGFSDMQATGDLRITNIQMRVQYKGVPATETPANYFQALKADDSSIATVTLLWNAGAYTKAYYNFTGLDITRDETNGIKLRVTSQNSAGIEPEPTQE